MNNVIDFKTKKPLKQAKVSMVIDQRAALYQTEQQIHAFMTANKGRKCLGFGFWVMIDDEVAGDLHITGDIRIPKAHEKDFKEKIIDSFKTYKDIHV